MRAVESCLFDRWCDAFWWHEFNLTQNAYIISNLRLGPFPFSLGSASRHCTKNGIRFVISGGCGLRISYNVLATRYGPLISTPRLEMTSSVRWARGPSAS